MCICSNRVYGLIVHTYSASCMVLYPIPHHFSHLIGPFQCLLLVFVVCCKDWSFLVLICVTLDQAAGFPVLRLGAKKPATSLATLAGGPSRVGQMEGKHGQMEGSWQDGHSLEIFAHQCVVNSEMILWHSLRLQVMLASILQVNSLYHLYPFVTKSRCWRFSPTAWGGQPKFWTRALSSRWCRWSPDWLSRLSQALSQAQARLAGACLRRLLPAGMEGTW
jgi:hypothetical protein